jgi:hypothetical protein
MHQMNRAWTTAHHNMFVIAIIKKKIRIRKDANGTLQNIKYCISIKYVINTMCLCILYLYILKRL